MKEKLKLVKSFGELKVSDYVLVVNCKACGISHKEILTKLTYSMLHGPCWEHLPMCRHLEGKLTRATVKDGRVFLIDTGLESQSDVSVEKVKPKKLVDINR